ncbi:MAG: hypothetical protein [Olavius algarvensis Gamma 1 endosymbiont]|nr:MAG: hypothetical protein [Olavius algarvensis Gamma 1 endosymbiont]
MKFINIRELSTGTSLFSCPRIFCPRKARKNTKGRTLFFSVSFVFSVDPLFFIRVCLRGS